MCGDTCKLRYTIIIESNVTVYLNLHVSPVLVKINLRPSSGADLFMSQTQHITLNLRTQRGWSLIQVGMAILSFLLSERLKNQVHSKQQMPKLTCSFSKLWK